MKRECQAGDLMWWKSREIVCGPVTIEAIQHDADGSRWVLIEYAGVYRMVNAKMITKFVEPFI